MRSQEDVLVRFRYKRPEIDSDVGPYRKKRGEKTKGTMERLEISLITERFSKQVLRNGVPDEDPFDWILW